MRFINISLGAFALGGLAAVAFAQTPDTVGFGHFYRLPPKVVKGRTIWPQQNDTVDISRLPDGNALVKLDLGLAAQSCAFTGVARFEGGELVYREGQGDPDRDCMIAFSNEAGRLHWRDYGRCSARCPTGGLTGNLPLRHRTAALPVTRIEGRQAALAEWRGAAARR